MAGGILKTTVAWILLGVALAGVLVVGVLGYALAKGCDDSRSRGPKEER